MQGKKEPLPFRLPRQPHLPAEDFGETDSLLFDQEVGGKQTTEDHVQGRVLSEEEILKQELEKFHHKEEALTGSLIDLLEKSQSISERKTEILGYLDGELGQARKILLRTNQEGGGDS